MTELFRCRIEAKLLAQATRVAKEMGTSPGEVVRMLFAQMVKRRELPFKPACDPAKPDDLLDAPRRNRILVGLDDSEGW